MTENADSGGTPDPCEELRWRYDSLREFVERLPKSCHDDEVIREARAVLYETAVY